MEDPINIFPPKKAAQFDEQGRPFHPFFYTRIPNYYQALYDMVEHMEKLDKIQDDEIRQGLQPSAENKADLASSSWLPQADMEKLFLEPLMERQYNYFVTSAERLMNHPYSAVCKEFLMRFRRVHKTNITGLVIPPLEYDEHGRPYIFVKYSRKQTAVAQVKLWGNGSGRIKINSKDITYFERTHHREQIFTINYHFFNDKKINNTVFTRL
ncbi:small ribosomal subunit protein uS9m [Diachasmimorpha longicaudata]|uniref:small ribosomal subunit protein uS9m n=1 Tax=Diachasmimorpha longicaudata TaxID=58733 RepID=UPI0030B8B988